MKNSCNHSLDFLLNSTKTSVIQTSDTILETIDKKQLAAVVLLGMSEAFKSIDLGILINKPQYVGLSPYHQVVL